MNALSTKKDPNDPCDAEYTVGMRSHEQIDAYHARRAAIRLLAGYVKPRVDSTLYDVLSIIGCTVVFGAFGYVICMVLIILFGGK